MKRNATSGFAAASAIASVYGMKWAVRYGADRERDHHSCRADRARHAVRHAGRGLIKIFVQVATACFGENTITDWLPGRRTPASHARRCLAGDCREIGGQAAVATGESASLAAWK